MPCSSVTHTHVLPSSPPSTSSPGSKRSIGKRITASAKRAIKWSVGCKATTHACQEFLLVKGHECGEAEVEHYDEVTSYNSAGGYSTRSRCKLRRLPVCKVTSSESAYDEDIPNPTLKRGGKNCNTYAEVEVDESSIRFVHTKSSGTCDTTIKPPAQRRKEGDPHAFGYRPAEAFKNTFTSILVRGKVEAEVSRESEREKRE